VGGGFGGEKGVGGGGGGVEHPNRPPRYATGRTRCISRPR